MRKLVVSVLIILLFLFTLCHHDDDKVILEGKILNLTSSYFISSYNISDSIVVDTIFLDKKGKFSYQHHVDTNRILTLYFDDFEFSKIVFVEKGVNKIKLKGDATLPDLIEVKGGEVNNDLTHFTKENETSIMQRSLLISRIDDEDDYFANSTNIISEKDQIAFLNSLNHDLAQKVEDYIQMYPGKISSVILINEFYKNDENPRNLNRILGYLSEDVSDYPLTKKLKSLNDKLMLSSEGAYMPYFKLIDTTGKSVSSNDYRDKYLLISFLSANNHHSDDNLSILKDEYSILNKDSIEFLSIYIDSDTFPIFNPAIDSIPWKVVIENKSWGSDIVESYNVNHLPCNILINPDGKIETRDAFISEIKNLIISQTDESNQ